MINLNNLYKFLLSRFIEKKEFKKSIWVQNYLKIRQNEYVNLYPNIASFAFDRIGANIFVYGIYEKEILIGLKETIFKNSNFKNAYCLDVGANIGNHSIYFSQFFEKVLSYEPHPRVFKLLKFNTEEYKNIECFGFGLSNKNGKISFSTHKKTSSGENKIVKNLEFINNNNIINIEISKFDNLYLNIKNYDKIKFIKLDVEEHEIEALEGMEQFIKKFSPIICFEIRSDVFYKSKKNMTSETIEFLKKNEYKYFYEIDYKRIWKSKNNLLKIYEVLRNGAPKRVHYLKKINKFVKKEYYAIITSKNELHN